MKLKGKLMQQVAGNRCFMVSLAEEVVIPAGHRMVVSGKVLAGESWMVDSLSKPPGGKWVMVSRSLVKEGTEKVSVKMFYPSDEDVLLWKTTHAAPVRPVEVDENSSNQNHQMDKVVQSAR